MRSKPQVTRYYKSIQTGQYGEMTGPKIAIDHVLKSWRKMKPGKILMRVTRKEFKKNVVYPLIGYSTNFSPTIKRIGKKLLRLERPNYHLSCSMYFYPWKQKANNLLYSHS